MHTSNERGVALVLALLLTAALSTLAASLMFLSQTETYATMNYRMMSQARYAGEAGVQKAAHFLLDSTQYTVPAVGAADDLNNYDRTVSPVTYLGQPVILSASASTSSNYPVAGVRTAFNNAAQGTLTAGNARITYNAVAKLVTMQAFTAYGGTAGVVQTWEITGTGGVTGARTATVEVVAVIETPRVSANSYAAFATATGCGAITFQGDVIVDSYDSREGPPGTGPGNSTESSGGDVGTNGNLQIGGSVAVQGNLYTPRTGVGACEEGAVTALSETGTAEVTGSVVQLPKAVVYPAPTFSVTPPTTPVTIDSDLLALGQTAACTALGLIPVTNCTVSGSTLIVNPPPNVEVALPSVTVDHGIVLKIVGASPAQTVNINSLAGTGSVEFESNMTGPLNESVVLKVAGKNADGTEMITPFDLSDLDSWKQNSPAQSYDAAALQVLYGGSGNIVMKGGNSQSAATIYAPNAGFTFKGTQDLFGSILAKTITNDGNASIHYDRRLSSDFYVAGQPMIGTFTWKRF